MKELKLVFYQAWLFFLFRIEAFFMSFFYWLFRLFGNRGSLLFYFFSVCLLRLLFFFSFLKIDLIHKEEIPSAGPLVLFVNHEGFWEPMYLMVSLPWQFRSVANEDFLNVPFMKKVLLGVDALIYRKGNNLPFLSSIVNTLRNNGVVAFFRSPKNGSIVDEPLIALVQRLAVPAQVVFVDQRLGEKPEEGLYSMAGKKKVKIGPCRFFSQGVDAVFLLNQLNSDYQRLTQEV